MNPTEGSNKSIDLASYRVLTFDCYGTLIDWENGIVTALQPVLKAHRIVMDGEKLLVLYSKIEPSLERGAFVRYREVLRGIVERLGRDLGFEPSPAELNCLADSLKDWKPFADTVESLQSLKKRFKLAIISNVNDELIAYSIRRLQVKFDWIITAEQAKAYKPSHKIFHLAIKTIKAPSNKILHVAQSIYHDIVPAKALGLATVWVNRWRGRTGFGATPAAKCNADWEVPDLKTLADA